MRRSMLFMPGAKPGNLLNADIYGADSIIIDLEDAVTLEEKDSARILTKHALRTFNYNCEVIVRINAVSCGKSARSSQNCEKCILSRVRSTPIRKNAERIMAASW